LGDIIGFKNEFENRRILFFYVEELFFLGENSVWKFSRNTFDGLGTIGLSNLGG